MIFSFVKKLRSMYAYTKMQERNMYVVYYVLKLILYLQIFKNRRQSPPPPSTLFWSSNSHQWGAITYDTNYTFLFCQVHLETATKEFAQAHTFLDNGMKTPLLCTATDPEVKRKIIGDTFVTIAEKVSHIINKLNRMSVCACLCKT